jgi:HPt (histidine-containing phosphotransfer) domain-containing protein
LDLYENDIEHALDMFQTYIELLPENIALLIEQCEEKEYTKLGKTFHKIKPSFGMVGLKHLENLAKHLEISVPSMSNDARIKTEIKHFITECMQSEKIILNEIERMKDFLENKA